MITVKRLPQFDTWLSGLRDGVTKGRLLARLRKVQLGNFGAGWRMYYVQRGSVLIVMLGGGDKSTQEADIISAKRLSGSLVD